MNLLESLRKCLSENQKNISDIEWAGSEYLEIPLQCFFKLSAQIEDDFMSEIPIDLLAVGKDFWVERVQFKEDEYEWKYRMFPKKPKNRKELKALSTKFLTSEEVSKVLKDERSSCDFCVSDSELWMMTYIK